MTTLTQEQQFLVDFNFHDVATALGLPVPDSVPPLMYGLEPSVYAAYAAEAEAAVALNAELLHSQFESSRVVSKLGLSAGKRVVLLGDSITTYRYSYGRVLAALLRRHGVETINRGYSGYTSTHGLELTYTQFLAHDPDVVLIKYGVNDTKRFGSPLHKMLITLDEYRLNLNGMLEAFQKHSRARIIVLTPTPVVEEVVNNNPDIMAMRLTWHNEDLLRFAAAAQAVARAHDVTCVDLTDVLGTPPDPALYVPDGLHPNADGHQLIAARLLKTLLDA